MDDTRCFKVGEIYKTLGTVCHVAFLFNIQANIHLLKKGKARKYKTHSFYGNKKKPIPIVTLVPDVGQQVFCHVLFEVFFSYVCFFYD